MEVEPFAALLIRSTLRSGSSSVLLSCLLITRHLSRLVYFFARRFHSAFILDLTLRQTAVPCHGPYILMSIPAFLDEFAELHDIINQFEKAALNSLPHLTSLVWFGVKVASFVYPSVTPSLLGIALSIAEICARIGRDLRRTELLNGSVDRTSPPLALVIRKHWIAFPRNWKSLLRDDLIYVLVDCTHLRPGSP